MAHLILIVIGAAVVGVIGFGVTWLLTGRDQGLGPVEPDGAATPLATSRPLIERDVSMLRFDTTTRGYRMGQVDAALRRVAYDIGYKQELINVLEAENAALRDGRVADADALRDARARSAEAGAGGVGSASAGVGSSHDGPDRSTKTGSDAVADADVAIDGADVTDAVEVIDEPGRTAAGRTR